MATREQLQEFVCGHGCVLDTKRGMGTNGPCRHMEFPRHLSDEDKRIWRGLLEATRVHRRRADELETENARLREAGGQLRMLFDTEMLHYEHGIRSACKKWDAAKRGTHG